MADLKIKSINIRPHYGGITRYMLNALRDPKLDRKVRTEFEKTIQDIADYAERQAATAEELKEFIDDNP